MPLSVSSSSCARSRISRSTSASHASRVTVISKLGGKRRKHCVYVPIGSALSAAFALHRSHFQLSGVLSVARNCSTARWRFVFAISRICARFAPESSRIVYSLSIRHTLSPQMLQVTFVSKDSSNTDRTTLPTASSKRAASSRHAKRNSATSCCPSANLLFSSPTRATPAAVGPMRPRASAKRSVRRSVLRSATSAASKHATQSHTQAAVGFFRCRDCSANLHVPIRLSFVRALASIDANRGFSINICTPALM